MQRRKVLFAAIEAMPEHVACENELLVDRQRHGAGLPSHGVR